MAPAGSGTIALLLLDESVSPLHGKDAFLRRLLSRVKRDLGRGLGISDQPAAGGRRAFGGVRGTW